MDKNYIITDYIFNKILDEILIEINNNEDIIEVMNKIDGDFYSININNNTFVNIINKYKNRKVTQKEKTTNTLALYYGNLYITINLCLEAIRSNTRIFIGIEDMQLGMNKLIINIINTILKNYKIFNLIKLENLLSIKEIEEKSKEVDNIICIGNKDLYYIYLKKGIKKLNFYPYNNTDLYCDSKDFEELKYLIYNYAYENNLELELYDDLDINKVINNINNYGQKYKSVILTSNKKNAETFIRKIKSEKIYVNENPFKDMDINIVF